MKLKTLNEQANNKDIINILQRDYSDCFEALIDNNIVLIRTVDDRNYTGPYKRNEWRRSVYQPSVSSVTQDLAKWDSRWSNFDPRGISVFMDNAILEDYEDTPETVMGPATHICFVKNNGKYNVCGSGDFNEDWPALSGETYSDVLARLSLLVRPEYKITDFTLETLIQYIVKQDPEEYAYEIQEHPSRFYENCGPDANNFFVTKDPNHLVSGNEVWTSSEIFMVPYETMIKILQEVNSGNDYKDSTQKD